MLSFPDTSIIPRVLNGILILALLFFSVLVVNSLWLDGFNFARSDDTKPVSKGTETEIPSSSQLPGERYPFTRLRKLTSIDEVAMSQSETQYAINEMFARHGAWFPNAKIRLEFQKFSWYQPRKDFSLDQIERDFSPIESNNLRILSASRDHVQRNIQTQPRSSTSSSDLPRSQSNPPFHQGTWVMKQVAENPKDTDYFENTLRINGRDFTYTMKYKSVHRPGTSPWTNPKISHLRSFTSTTVYSGSIVSVGTNHFDAKIESVSWPDKSPLHTPPDEKNARRKIGIVWKYIYQNGVLMDARNTDTVFSRP